MNYLSMMVPIVQEAGNIAMSRFREDIAISHKIDGSICTDVDLMCEAFLKDRLSLALPGSGFIAEESVADHIQEYTWVIDPIDGTKNFAYGLPYFAINLALMHHQRIIAAVTYMPALGDLFYAAVGEGSWRNGKRLTIDGHAHTKMDALVAISAAQLQDHAFMEKVQAPFNDLPHGVRFRVCGAAAVDLAYVAAGFYDGAMFENLKWWDAAAGILLICEAGGAVFGYDHTVIKPPLKMLLVGNREFCARMVTLLPQA